MISKQAFAKTLVAWLWSDFSVHSVSPPFTLSSLSLVCLPTHSHLLCPNSCHHHHPHPSLSLCLQIRPVELQAAGLVNWNSRVLRPGQWALCFPPKHLQAPRQPHTCFRIHTHTHAHKVIRSDSLKPPANILHFTNAKQLRSCEQVGSSILLKETKRRTVYLQI